MNYFYFIWHTQCYMAAHNPLLINITVLVGHTWHKVLFTSIVETISFFKKKKNVAKTITYTLVMFLMIHPVAISISVRLFTQGKAKHIAPGNFHTFKAKLKHSSAYRRRFRRCILFIWSSDNPALLGLKASDFYTIIAHMSACTWHEIFHIFLTFISIDRPVSYLELMIVLYLEHRRSQ